MEHFADRLLAAIADKGSPVCVGLDPVWERLPAPLRRNGSDNASAAVVAISEFVHGVLEAVAPHVPCVKLQSACFERYLWRGVEAYHHAVSRAAELGLIVIGDAKRGDIGISAEHYAAGCLSDPRFDDIRDEAGPDALTINSYFGRDGIDPFVEVARKQGKGLFALVRTSNPGGDAIQGLALADGRTVAEAVATLVAELGSGSVGRSGYSLLGAVVGATKAKEVASLRALMPQQIFLVPGFGAQGGSADDVRGCFKPDGTGAVITASRSVLFAFEKSDESDWRVAIAKAAQSMKREVNQILGG